MKKGILEKVFSSFCDIKQEEIKRALLLIAGIFVLLVSYYIMKTLREPMILAASESDARVLESGHLWPWLKDFLSMHGPYKRVVAAACQSLLLLGFVPLFSLVASKLKGFQLIFAVTGFFMLNLGYFAFAMYSGIAFTGFLFFIWVGIFSVAMVSVFWSYAADIYSDEEGRRLFAFIGLGASLGAPLGAMFADKLFEAKVSEWGIMGVSFASLLIFLFFMWFVERDVRAGSGEVRKAVLKEESCEIKGGKFDGFWLVLKSPYLFSMAMVILLLNLVNTTGEYLLSEAVVGHVKSLVMLDGSLNEKAAIGQVYANFYFWVNIISFILQAVVVSRLVKYVGVKSLIFMLPLISLGVYAFIAVGVGFVAMRWMKTAENSTNYSVMNTAKAMLFLVVNRDEKYKAKQAIDTFFVRMGDMIAALVIIFIGGGLQFGVRGIALINVCFVLVWLAVSWVMYRYYKVLAKGDGEIDVKE